MNNDNYDSLRLGNKNDDGQSVLISDLADRPNAFNSYRESKLSASDLKAIFDRSFLYVKSRFNNLIDVLKQRDRAVDNKLSEHSNKFQEIDESIRDIASDVGDVGAALDELHAYAETLKGGDE